MRMIGIIRYAAYVRGRGGQDNAGASARGRFLKVKDASWFEHLTTKEEN